ncbi:hypothetical protein [Paraburkholderia sp. RL17-337-BIB-A]|uniref:hypothetical protein n=1 Tax=Paraburkholderia sp. RL17-337-BIB-A TaxID=3031636 RepID=UPI0038BC37FE
MKNGDLGSLKAMTYAFLMVNGSKSDAPRNYYVNTQYPVQRFSAALNTGTPMQPAMWRRIQPHFAGRRDYP